MVEYIPEPKQFMFKEGVKVTVYSKRFKEAEDSCTSAGGKWLTIRGTHVCVKDGESPADAFKRTTGKDLDDGDSTTDKTQKDINIPKADNKTGKDMTAKKKYSNMITPTSYKKPIVLINDNTGETAVFDFEHETRNAVGYKTKRGVVWLPKSNAIPANMMYDAKTRQVVKDLGFSTHSATAYRVKDWLWQQHAIGIQKYRELDPSYK